MKNTKKQAGPEAGSKLNLAVETTGDGWKETEERLAAGREKERAERRLALARGGAK